MMEMKVLFYFEQTPEILNKNKNFLSLFKLYSVNFDCAAVEGQTSFLFLSLKLFLLHSFCVLIC